MPILLKINNTIIEYNKNILYDNSSKPVLLFLSLVINKIKGRKTSSITIMSLIESLKKMMMFVDSLEH